MFTFHHISLSVINLVESINFYSCLGFEPALIWESEDKKNKIAHLKNSDCFMELFYFDNYQKPKKIDNLEQDLKIIGIKHFALKVESVTNTEKLFRQKNFSIITPITQGKTGIKYFFIKDPNGIFIEIVEDGRGLVVP